MFNIQAGGLLEALQLPQAKSGLPGSLTQQQREQFLSAMQGLKGSLQQLAAQAPPSDFQPLESQRTKLYEAFQKASAQTGKVEPQAVEQTMQRLQSAIQSISDKAESMLSGVLNGQQQWQEREPEFDSLMDRIGELEEAGHPKAGTLRGLGDAILARANQNQFQESVAALDQLRPKFEKIFEAHQQWAITRAASGAAVDAVSVVGGGLANIAEGVMATPGNESGDQPVDGASPPDGGNEKQRLQNVIEVVAEQEGIDIAEIGDIKDLPADLVKLAQQILEQLSPGAIAKDAIKQAIKDVANLVGDLVKKLIAGIKDIIAKRRIPQICLVSVHNNTDKKLTLAKWNFVSGRGNWSKGNENVPHNTIAAGETNTFKAQSPANNPLFGVVARMVYEIDETEEDGRRPDLKWIVKFSNPRDASIDADTNLRGKQEDEYKSPQPKSNESGDTAAFAFQLNLAKDADPPEPELPEIEDEDDDNKGGGDNGKGGGTTPPVADAQASCLIKIVNNSSVALTLLDQGHDRGDFMTSPSPTVQAGATIEFVSVETPNSDDEGCKGFAEWQIGDSASCTWRTEWDNPEGAKNTTTSTISGDDNKAYRELDQIGQGDENVPVSFTLSATGGGETPVTPPGGKEADLVIRVTDEESGEGISNAMVAIAGQSTITDNVGGVTMKVPVGSQSYEASGDGYEPFKGTVEVKEADNDVLEIRLKATCENRQGLTVVVKDKESGDRLEGASVTVGDQTDSTSDRGLATVELPVGKHNYKATLTGYDDATGNVDIIDGDNPELIIEMTKGCDGPREGLTVVVIEKGTGTEIEGASVTVGDQTDTTSSLGLATVELPVGVHDYKVTKSGYKEKSDKVTIIEGDNPELIVELEKCDGKTKTLNVLVRDKESTDPIPNATVKVGPETMTSGPDGKGTVDVEVGSHDWEATAKDYKDEQGTVDVKEEANEELVIDMTKDGECKNATVTFTVIDEDTGQPLEGADVTLGTQLQKTDASGQTQFSTEAGQQDFSATKENYEIETGQVEAKADEDTPVEVKLRGWNPPPETPQPTLRKGDEGADGWVEYLQNLLNKHVGSGTVDVNGTFDDRTYKGVKAFQNLPVNQPPELTPGMLVDGIVGNETWSMLRRQPREPVGVRNKDTHVEQGAEARWATEKNDFVTYDANADTLTLTAFSVGDTAVDSFEAMIRVTHVDSGENMIWSEALGAPTQASPTGGGHEHKVVIQGVRGGTGGRRKVEAYMPKELGGDYWSDEMDFPAVQSGGGSGESDASQASGGSTDAGSGATSSTSAGKLSTERRQQMNKDLADMNRRLDEILKSYDPSARSQSE